MSSKISCKMYTITRKCCATGDWLAVHPATTLTPGGPSVLTVLRSRNSRRLLEAAMSPRKCVLAHRSTRWLSCRVKSRSRRLRYVNQSIGRQSKSPTRNTSPTNQTRPTVQCESGKSGDCLRDSGASNPTHCKRVTA